MKTGMRYSGSNVPSLRILEPEKPLQVRRRFTFSRKTQGGVLGVIYLTRVEHCPLLDSRQSSPSLLLPVSRRDAAMFAEWTRLKARVDVPNNRWGIVGPGRSNGIPQLCEDLNYLFIARDDLRMTLGRENPSTGSSALTLSSGVRCQGHSFVLSFFGSLGC
jgi:hypothetical protein